MKRQRALGSPHLWEEGFLIGILDVLEIGRGDLHFMWLNKNRKIKKHFDVVLLPVHVYDANHGMVGPFNGLSPARLRVTGGAQDQLDNS